MNQHIEAVFENGVFRPLGPVDLPEHQRVKVHVANVEASDNQEPWTEEKNKRRCDLIDKEIEGTITDAEQTELEALQRQTVAHRDSSAPLSIEGARTLHQKLVEKKHAAQE